MLTLSEALFWWLKQPTTQEELSNQIKGMKLYNMPNKLEEFLVIGQINSESENYCKNAKKP